MPTLPWATFKHKHLKCHSAGFALLTFSESEAVFEAIVETEPTACLSSLFIWRWPHLKQKKSQNKTTNPFVFQWPIKACPVAIPPSGELTGAIPRLDLLCSLLTALKLLVTPSVLQTSKEGSTTPSSCTEENVVFCNCTAFKCACSIPREYLRYPLSICV